MLHAFVVVYVERSQINCTFALLVLVCRHLESLTSSLRVAVRQRGRNLSGGLSPLSWGGLKLRCAGWGRALIAITAVSRQAGLRTIGAAGTFDREQ